MKITLLVVGKTLNGAFKKGVDDYVERLSHYVGFKIECLSDVKTTKKTTPAQQKIDEGVSILNFVQKSDCVVLLDEHGKEFTSVEFAKFISKKEQSVSKRLVFVVGGPYGFSKDVYDRANEKISMSKMTFPHELIRLIFVEQLYRAYTIINNQPYHHE